MSCGSRTRRRVSRAVATAPSLRRPCRRSRRAPSLRPRSPRRGWRPPDHGLRSWIPGRKAVRAAPTCHFAAFQVSTGGGFGGDNRLSRWNPGAGVVNWKCRLRRLRSRGCSPPSPRAMQPPSSGSMPRAAPRSMASCCGSCGGPSLPPTSWTSPTWKSCGGPASSIPPIRPRWPGLSGSPAAGRSIGPPAARGRRRARAGNRRG